MAPTYKLNYFPVKGRGEAIRMVLATAGVEFEDNRITNWPEVKSDKSRFPQHQMPSIEIDGKFYCQAPAICRYLAAEHGLYGSTNMDRFTIDQICETMTDMFIDTAEALYAKVSDEEKLEKLKGIFTSDKHKAKFNFLQELLVSCNGGAGYFLGDKISLGDIHFFMAYDIISGSYPQILDDYPQLKALTERVANHENLKKYLASRPQTKN